MSTEWDIYQQRELLLLETRQKILEAVYRKPGLHFRELARITGLATGQLEYHLYKLEKAGLLRAEKDGKYTRYYPPVDLEDRVEKVLKMLNRPRVREILEYLLENSHADASAISKFLGVSPSAATWHLKNLVSEGVLLENRNGSRKLFEIRDPEAVLEALRIHREGMLDVLAKKLAEMWAW